MRKMIPLLVLLVATVLINLFLSDSGYAKVAIIATGVVWLLEAVERAIFGKGK